MLLFIVARNQGIPFLVSLRTHIMFGDRAEAGRACPVFVIIRFGSTGKYKAITLEDIEALLLLREIFGRKGNSVTCTHRMYLDSYFTGD
jgi:hypothetical protein